MRFAVLAVTAVAASSCAEPIDTRRRVEAIGSLGDDIYGAMCDRLGASSFTEDVEGASYRGICHYDRNGAYASVVDQSRLPAPKGEAAQIARGLSIQKLERMAAWRPELVAAFNAGFPDLVVDNPATDDPSDTIRLHDALLEFSSDVTPLYESNPIEVGAGPLMPNATQAIGRVLAGLESSEPARAALGRIAGRFGYRPFQAGLGVVRVALAYPELRAMARSLLPMLGPSGAASAEFQQLLAVLQKELRHFRPEIAALPPYVVDAATGQPNRPRETSEAAAALLLDESDQYLRVQPVVRRYIAARDSRGFAVPLGNSPGLLPTTVPPPFVDLNFDGYADVDASGRFTDAAGMPLLIDPPFFVPGTPTSAALDEYGRPMNSPYTYLDTTRTFTGALAHDLIPLVDPTAWASPDSAEPWLEEHEALMYAMAGAQVVLGPRELAQYDYAAETRVPLDQPCPDCLPYTRFRGEESAIADFAHAAGQLLAHPDSDAVLLALMDLAENHEQVLARLLGAALRIKEIADEHDARAAQGEEEWAALPYELPIYDQMAQVLSDIAHEPGLVTAVAKALADPMVVQEAPEAPGVTGDRSPHYGATLGTFMSMRDYYTYDPNNLNGPAYNVTDGYPSLANPHNPVDRSAPLNGTNRSLMERSIQQIAGTFGVRSCNKDNAYVFLGVGDMTWPLAGAGYVECELFQFDDMGAFYFDSLLPEGHPKRSYMLIKPVSLQTLMDVAGVAMTPDAMLEMMSGITGMTQHPNQNALDRLIFFGADSEQFGQLHDYDAQNANTNTAKFITSMMEPFGTGVCAENGNGVPHCTTDNEEGLMRVRDWGTIMSWERLGFGWYMMPQAIAFVTPACNADQSECDLWDYTGETMYGNLVKILWQHWPGPDHGEYCNNTGNADTNPYYCSEAGINRYEPILAEAFSGDIIPALHEFSVAAEELSVTIARGPKAGQVLTGPEIVEILARVLFDQQYAASVNMRDLRGNAGCSWTDGTPQAQVTPYNMFADALHKMDLRWAQACDCQSLPPEQAAACEADRPGCEADAAARRSKWKRARSLLVDQFLAVEGQGEDSHFKNPAVPRVLKTLLRIVREQLNANCPDRESGVECVWAKRDLGQKLADTLSGPFVGSLVDLMDKMNRDESGRRELEKFLTYALMDGTAAEALQGMLASLSDVLQLLSADGDLAPLLNAASNAASPAADPAGAGALDRAIQVVDAMARDDFDRYHVLDYVLPALVTPMNDGAGRTPLEIIIDAIADIHRIEAARVDPLSADDYQAVLRTVREFLVSETRGFEQLYYIVQNRRRD